MNRLAPAVAALLVSLAVGAAGARAGTYQVLACSQASGAVNNSWQAFNSDPTHLSTGQVCPPAAGSGEPPKSTGMFVTEPPRVVWRRFLLSVLSLSRLLVLHWREPLAGAV